MPARLGIRTQGWLVNAARCAYRNNNDIDNLNNNRGFRVVASHAFPFFLKQNLRVLGELGDLPLPEMLYVHGRKPRRNRRDGAVMPWLDVFLFHHWAMKVDWGGRSGKYKRDSRFAWHDHLSVSRPFYSSPSTFNLQPSTFNFPTFNLQLSNLQLSTCNHHPPMIK